MRDGCNFCRPCRSIASTFVLGHVVLLLEKHGNAGVSHIAADRLPRLGDDVDLAFSHRHSDAAFELIQTAAGRQRDDSD